MSRLLRAPNWTLLLLLLTVSPVVAQTPTQPAVTEPRPAVSELTSPLTTTFDGDTGLWYIPSARVLGARQYSVSAYRRGTNYVQGYTNVADFAGTFAFGLTEFAEVFGSFSFVRRIDRDVRPLFVNDPAFGGVVDRHPHVDAPWSGNKVGDFSIGAKVNLWSESRLNAADMALRAIVKLPTGDTTVSTDQSDFMADFVVSKEARQLVEIAGYAGYEWVGSPDDYDLPGGAFRWGAGATFPSRKLLRAFTEFNGRILSHDTVTATGAPVTATGGPPATSAAQNLTTMTLGLTAQTVKGFFVGTGISWNGPSRERDAAYASDKASGDYWDWQVRIGYHPGRRAQVAAPRTTPSQTPPQPPPTPQNRPPTVLARCNPCTIEPGGSLMLTAEARDPDGDTLTYRWIAPAGTLAQGAEPQTTWSAPEQEGSVRVVVTVDDGKGGTASAEVMLQVNRRAPAARTYTFEDVYFDFDRTTLRPEARQRLDDAVKLFQSDTALRVLIEGHTCNIGTSEYNLALGDRRANAVRDYLISRGVPLDRLTTTSYGEEQPKFDNSREETRRLNRRAVLTVRVQ